MYRAIRLATLAVARRGRVRIVHISLQRSHIHMIVEAANRTLLARGLQGFEISAARHINTVLATETERVRNPALFGARWDDVAGRRGARPCRRGRVFSERYFMEIVTSPTQAHHAIRYVLGNWRRHGEDREGAARDWLVDLFSSGVTFADWTERSDPRVRWPSIEASESLRVEPPQTWLLAHGWKRVGEISVYAVPRGRR